MLQERPIAAVNVEPTQLFHSQLGARHLHPMLQKLRRNFLARTVRELHIAPELCSRQLRCNSHSIRNGSNLVVLEIFGPITIVTVCIVLATPIKLHPVRAVLDADPRTTSGSVLQRASKRPDTDTALLIDAITVLLPQGNISFLC
jgi:hypothetical protein